MLIEIINTEIDLENSLKRIVITNLLNSFRMGYHIIVFENEVLEKIIKSEHFLVIHYFIAKTKSSTLDFFI